MRGSIYSSEQTPQVAEEGVFDAIVTEEVAVSTCMVLEDYELLDIYEHIFIKIGNFRTGHEGQILRC